MKNLTTVAKALRKYDDDIIDVLFAGEARGSLLCINSLDCDKPWVEFYISDTKIIYEEREYDFNSKKKRLIGEKMARFIENEMIKSGIIAL